MAPRVSEGIGGKNRRPLPIKDARAKAYPQPNRHRSQLSKERVSRGSTRNNRALARMFEFLGMGGVVGIARGPRPQLCSEAPQLAAAPVLPRPVDLRQRLVEQVDAGADLAGGGGQHRDPAEEPRP